MAKRLFTLKRVEIGTVMNQLDIVAGEYTSQSVNTINNQNGICHVYVKSVGETPFTVTMEHSDDDSTFVEYSEAFVFEELEGTAYVGLPYEAAFEVVTGRTKKFVRFVIVTEDDNADVVITYTSGDKKEIPHMKYPDEINYPLEALKGGTTYTSLDMAVDDITSVVAYPASIATDLEDYEVDYLIQFSSALPAGTSFDAISLGGTPLTPSALDLEGLTSVYLSELIDEGVPADIVDKADSTDTYVLGLDYSTAITVTATFSVVVSEDSFSSYTTLVSDTVDIEVTTE